MADICRAGAPSCGNDAICVDGTCAGPIPVGGSCDPNTTRGQCDEQLECDANLVCVDAADDDDPLVCAP